MIIVLVPLTWAGSANFLSSRSPVMAVSLRLTLFDSSPGMRRSEHYNSEECRVLRKVSNPMSLTAAKSEAKGSALRISLSCVFSNMTRPLAPRREKHHNLPGLSWRCKSVLDLT
jgi:hypothetical protein